MTLFTAARTSEVFMPSVKRCSAFSKARFLDLVPKKASTAAHMPRNRSDTSYSQPARSINR
jgi:hypothetical protein